MSALRLVIQFWWLCSIVPDIAILRCGLPLRDSEYLPYSTKLEAACASSRVRRPRLRSKPLSGILTVSDSAPTATE